MHLLLVGISHRTAPVDVRERVDFTVHGLPAALDKLAGCGSTSETIFVSTSNRAQI